MSWISKDTSAVPIRESCDPVEAPVLQKPSVQSPSIQNARPSGSCQQGQFEFTESLSAAPGAAVLSDGTSVEVALLGKDAPSGGQAGGNQAGGNQAGTSAGSGSSSSRQPGTHQSAGSPGSGGGPKAGRKKVSGSTRIRPKPRRRSLLDPYTQLEIFDQRVSDPVLSDQVWESPKDKSEGDQPVAPLKSASPEVTRSSADAGRLQSSAKSRTDRENLLGKDWLRGKTAERLQDDSVNGSWVRSPLCLPPTPHVSSTLAVSLETLAPPARQASFVHRVSNFFRSEADETVLIEHGEAKGNAVAEGVFWCSLFVLIALAWFGV